MIDSTLLFTKIKYCCFFTGTRNFMAEHTEMIEDCKEVAVMSCNKDTVGKTRLQKWSRGIYIIASAGGSH